MLEQALTSTRLIVSPSLSAMDLEAVIAYGTKLQNAVGRVGTGATGNESRIMARPPGRDRRFRRGP